MQALQPRPLLLLLGPAFLMEAMASSTTRDSPHIPPIQASTNNNETAQNLSHEGDSPGIGESISLNARRLRLRNAGFRAALLPTRRLTPPRQPGIEAPATRLENIDNTSVGYTKARRSSPFDNTTQATVLQDFRNCSQRRISPRSPLGELFGFADDEKEDVNKPVHTVTMASGTGSIKAPRTRKSLRRSSNFQSTKYIEYLESELGTATKKLESLQSPQPDSGQAAKIRKLEKRTSELSRHLEDWEKSFEERVNDAVFEKVHGESSMRLKILTLEQAATHKDTHISELSKELEDTKIRLMEAETIEATLTKRVDVLTELLARSPTRTSFSISAAESSMPAKAIKPMLHRIATSPTRSCRRFEDPERRRSYIDGITSPIGNSAVADGTEMAKVDIETEDSSEASRPVSAVFSSFSSQISSSRPVSMFSTSSLSTWASADEKPPARARKSRRFAPGATGLKPLLLAASSGIHNQTSSIETPQRNQAQHQSGDDSYWESSEDLMSPTPSRPGLQRPYSWAPQSSVIRDIGNLVGEESDDDTFVVNTDCTNGIQSYLQDPTDGPLLDAKGEAFPDVSPLPTRRSLFQELNTRHQGPTSSSEDLDLAQEYAFPSGTIKARRKSTELTTTQISYLQSRQAGDFDHHDTNLSTIWRSILVMLNQKPLYLARQILLRSWSRNFTPFIQVVRRIMSTFLMPRQNREFLGSSYTAGPLPVGLSAFASMDASGKNGSVETQKHTLPTDNRSDKPENQPHFLRAYPQSKEYKLSNSSGHCSCCHEAIEKQRHVLWLKLTAALALAASYSLFKCPVAMTER